MLKKEDDSKLIWTGTGDREAFRGPVFTVREHTSRSPRGETGTFSILDAANWVMVVPVVDDGPGRRFVMVRQWRHGAGELSLEFPGGVLEAGEDAATGAARELLEETGYKAGELVNIGEFNPNPAIMSNRVTFFTALKLKETGVQHLDQDEFIRVEKHLASDVFHGMGKPPFIHALTATALCLYISHAAAQTDYKPDML